MLALENFLRVLYSYSFIGIIEIFMNIILGWIVFYTEFKMYRVLRGIKEWAWLKLAYALVGAMWAIMYSVVLFLRPELVPIIGATFVRPGVTITLSVIAAGAYWKLKCRG